MKILGVERYAISNRGYDTAHFEHSRGSAIGGASHATDQGGDLNVFSVEHNEDELWLNDNNGQPDNQWNSDNRFVFVRRNYPRFSPDKCSFLSGEFCFCNCPIQPPSILPTSSSGADNVAYLPVSSDFVSQRTISSTFKVSVLRIASRTYGGLSSFERKLAALIASMISMKIISMRFPSEYRCAFGSVL